MEFKEVQKKGDPRFKTTMIDRAVGVFSPKKAFDRMRYRAATTALTGGYQGADKSRRSTSNWRVSAGSADADTLPCLDTLRARSRDLLRNEPLACGAINTVVTNTVGTGLIPQSVPDLDALIEAGIPEGTIVNFQKSAERYFKNWAQSENCDSTRTQNFYGLQDLVFRSALESGDVFAIHRIISLPNWSYRTALQIVEADRVDNPSGKHLNTAELSAGVKRNKLGAPEGYYFLKEHPGHNRMIKNRGEADYVSAYYANGTRKVLHIFTRLRPEQSRGVPYLAPVIEVFKKLGRYSEAEIDAAVLSAMFTVFVKTEDGGGLADMVSPGESTSSSNEEVKLGNGAIIDLMKGEEIEIANPARPNPAFDPFVLAILRQIGVALELPFELLVKHFTASYSAAQAAMVEAWKFFKARRKWLADNFCTPVWESVIAEGVASGRIVAPGFFSDPMIRAAWLGVDWIGPPRGVIDMRKETDAYVTMEDRQWKTSAEITAELTGGDWEHKARTRANEEKFRRENKIVPPENVQVSAVSAEVKPVQKVNQNDQED